MLGTAYALVSGVYLGFYDPSVVISNLLFFMVLFLVPEILIVRKLFRSDARRQGLGLSVYVLANMVAGVVLFLSTMTCGFC